MKGEPIKASTRVTRDREVFCRSVENYYIHLKTFIDIITFMPKYMDDQLKNRKVHASEKRHCTKTERPMVDHMGSTEENIERLPTFENPKGFMRYGRIPYKIYRSLEHTEGRLVNQDNPGLYRITSDTGRGQSLSIWVWEGVPKDFRDIVFFHELKEAEFVFADQFSLDEAHNKAVQLHTAYARKFLPEDKFTEFIKWQSQYMN